MNIIGSTDTKNLMNGAIFESPYNVDFDDERTIAEFQSALEQAVSDVSAEIFDRVILNIETEDGETAFGIELAEILNDERLVVGMLGGPISRLWCPSSEAEDAIEYLMQDIALAVGEKFTCQFSYNSWC